MAAELIPGVIADAVDSLTITEAAWQMAYGEGVTHEEMLAARREILLGAGLAVAPAVAAAERESIRQFATEREATAWSHPLDANECSRVDFADLIEK